MLGTGSVFIAPGGGSLGAYLDGLRRLRALGLERLYPGHGPAVEDPDAKLDEYIGHRMERERRIVAALDAGARTEDELLAHAWDAIPDGLRLPGRVDAPGAPGEAARGGAGAVSDEPAHRQLMRSGARFRSSDPEIRADFERAQRRVRAVNATAIEDPAGRAPLLAELLGSLGEGSDIYPPLQCDYGYNVHLGDRTFLNYGAVLIDTCAIAIGDEVLLGPGVQLLTADHPLDAGLRRTAGSRAGRSRSAPARGSAAA